MSRDEIIAMAREAGFDVHFPGVNGDAAQPAVFGRCTSDMLERFAALVAAAERKACALLLERMTERRRWTRAGINGEPMRPCEYAAAIRNYPQIAWSDKCA